MYRRVFRVASLLAILLILLAAAGCRQGEEIGELQTKSETVELGDAASVQVEIDLSAGELVVSGGAAELLEADFTYNVAEMEPEVSYSGDELTVTHPEARIVGTLDDRDDYRNEWALRFNDGVPMEMLVNVGAGSSDLNLSSLSLTRLDIETVAGEATVDLSGSSSLTRLKVKSGVGQVTVDLTGNWPDDLDANITTGVGELILRLPESACVRVEVQGGIGNVDTGGLSRDGNDYVNDACGESDVTLRIDINAGVGNISLELEETMAQPASTGNVYQDPEGRFSITLVGDWTPVETDGTYVQVAYADAPLTLSLVTVETDDLEAGVEVALRQVGVDPAALTETDRGPWDKWGIIFYALGDGQGVSVLGQTSDGTSYYFVATGPEGLTANPPEDALETIQGFSLSGEVGLPATVEEFETYVNSFVGTRPPGLSIAIALEEDVLYEQGFGMADGPREMPAAPDTVYQWASVTKTVTAAAIMQLREQGLIDLDAPVSDYLDYFPAQYPITVRQLLTHSAGLPEPADFLLVHLRLKGQPSPDFDSMDREYYEGLSSLMFDPGSQSAYVNPDYITLGQVIAAVSGQPYVEYVQEHILKPLGMTNTDFAYSNDFMEANAAASAVPAAQAESIVALMDEARGLGDGADFFQEIGENVAWLYPYIVGDGAGGALLGPVTEMIRFGQMMLNEGELDGVRLLEPESVALLQEVQTSTSGEPLDIGLAWHFGGDAEHPYIEHDGGGTFQNKLRLYMQDGFAVAIMANGSGFDRNELADAAANVVFLMLGGQ